MRQGHLGPPVEFDADRGAGSPGAAGRRRSGNVSPTSPRARTGGAARGHLSAGRFSRAHSAADVRSATPIRRNTLPRCTFTVRSLMPSERRDLLVRHALRGQPQHLELAVAQLRRRRACAALGSSAPATRGSSGGVPGGAGADRGKQLGRRRVLEHVAGRAGRDRLANAVLVDERGQHDDADRPGAARAVRGSRSTPSMTRHRQVHQDEVDLGRRREFECRRTVRRLADDGDVVGGVEQRGEPGAHERMVVDQQDTDHAAPTVRRHARAVARRRPYRQIRAGRSSDLHHELQSRSGPRPAASRQRIPFRRRRSASVIVSRRPISDTVTVLASACRTALRTASCATRKHACCCSTDSRPTASSSTSTTTFGSRADIPPARSRSAAPSPGGLQARRDRCRPAANASPRSPCAPCRRPRATGPPDRARRATPPPRLPPRRRRRPRQVPARRRRAGLPRSGGARRATRPSIAAASARAARTHGARAAAGSRPAASAARRLRRSSSA